MQISKEGKARLIVLPIVVMLAIPMAVAGYQQSQENDVSLDQQIDAQRSTFLSEDNEESSENYTTREPIRIDGNQDFAEKAEENGWPGDGSEDDPYVIEGYEIDGGGHESRYQSGYTEDNKSYELPYEYGIYIGNVTDHFVIRECYIYNVTGKSALDGQGSNTYTPPGIFLFNSENGTIAKNKIYGSIALLASTHNVITKNTIRSVKNSSFDGHGISLCVSLRALDKNSVNNDIMNNTIYNKTVGISELISVNPKEDNENLHNNIENNTFINVEEEVSSGVSIPEKSSNNDSWFQTKSFYYSVILLGISMVILGVGWRRVKKEEKDEG